MIRLGDSGAGALSRAEGAPDRPIRYELEPMTGTVEIDPGGTHLLIRFPYDESLVAAVKELPGRRWDPRNKTWKVPCQHIDRVYATFAAFQFEFSSEASGLLAGTWAPPAKADEAAAGPTDGAVDQGQLPLGADGQTGGESRAPDAMTISQLTGRAKDGLRQLFPDPVWIVGEIVGYDKAADREHKFFQLAEQGKRAQRAVATVETALFGRTASWLLKKLEGSDNPLTLRDGIEIRALVRVDLFKNVGRFQVIIEDIDPEHTLGKLALTKEQIFKELQKLGIAEQNRALPFPVPALRIGVLASPDSDGWNDFLQHLQGSGCGLDVTLHPIKTQGQGLKPSLRRGLEWFERHAAEFDLLCIVRGGGSRTDLAWFDDQDIAQLVCRHPLKVLVGIGHERDQSVLDLVAHSEKTPTAAAGLIVELLRGARTDVKERAEQLQRLARELLQDLGDGLARTTSDLQRAATHRIRDERHGLLSAGRQLGSSVTLRLSNERNALLAAAARASNGSARRLERATLRLDGQAERLRLLDPRRVLERGFVLARDSDGNVVPSADRLSAGQQLVVQFRDGRATAAIERVEKDPSESKNQ